jgi:hypothetical protein
VYVSLMAHASVRLRRRSRGFEGTGRVWMPSELRSLTPNAPLSRTLRTYSGCRARVAHGAALRAARSWNRFQCAHGRSCARPTYVAVTDTLHRRLPSGGLEANLASTHGEKLTGCNDLTKLPRPTGCVSDMNDVCSNDVADTNAEAALLGASLHRSVFERSVVVERGVLVPGARVVRARARVRASKGSEASDRWLPAVKAAWP